MESRTKETYDTALYPADIVKRAADIYSRICRIELTQEPRRSVCLFYGEEAEQVKGEFGNFLIELAQQKGGQ